MTLPKVNETLQSSGVLVAPQVADPDRVTGAMFSHA